MTAPNADDNTRHPYDQIIIDITSYVFSYEVSSPKAFERARTALLDALGCAFETLKQSSQARLLVGPVVPGTEVPNGFKLPGTSYRLDPVKGAFDLGSLIRYLDHNDAFPGAEWGHPSDNIGAILAVADYVNRSARTTSSPVLTMRAVLSALIKAYEIQGCFQIRNAFNKVGLDHTILVRIASTAIVCYLLDCTEQQTLSALSHAFIDAGPLRTYRQSPNTGPRKGWAAGDACMRAVHLAFLAKQGQPGAPTILSDPKWGLYATLMQGKEFQMPKPFGTHVVETVFFKIHAAEGHAASAVEAALLLSRQLRVRHPPIEGGIEEAVSRVRVRTQKPAMIIINKQGALHNAADRDHCMQYMIAVVLLKGSMITSADYSDDSPWAMDPRVNTLRAKIDMIEDEQMTADYHNPQKRSGANALLVTLVGGEMLDEVLVEYPTGHPWRDDTPGLVKDKFEENVRGLFIAERSSDIVKLADMGLEDFIKMDVSQFVDTVAGSGEVDSLDTTPNGNEEKEITAAKSGQRSRWAETEDDNEKTRASSADKVDETSHASIDEGIKDTSSNDQAKLPVVDCTAALTNSKKELLTETGASEQGEPTAPVIDQVESTASAVAAVMTAVPGSPASERKTSPTRENNHTMSAKANSHQIADGVEKRAEASGTINGSAPHDPPQDQCEERKLPDNTASGETYVEAFPPGKTPHPSPCISYNIPYAEACAKHIDETFHATRVYILVSGTLSDKTDDLPRLHYAIDKRLGEDTVVGIKRGVKPHTYYSDILRIVKEAKDANANCLVTLGGGSLTDAAKVVALALANNATTVNELETLYFDSSTLRTPLLPATVPIICIPTSLSAGEYTPIAGATDDTTHHKHSFQHISIGPRLVILSPQLTTTTPLHVWLSTGIRAVDHCVESICSIKASAEGDAIAEKALRRLLPGLLTTKANPGDLSPRLACQLGAIDAISAPLNGVPMGASHGIGHQLGPLGVGHGETSCVLLPVVCKYNKRVNAEQQQRVLEILWSEEAVVNVLRKAGVERENSDLGDVLDTLFKALGMPRKLFEVGVAKDKFERLAVGSLNDRWCKTNPIPLTKKEQVLEILEMCIGDSSNYTETPSEERTFKNYTAAQAKAYIEGRNLDWTKLYNFIVDHHASTGGSFDMLFDVGCGPGNSTLPLAKHFSVVYAIDSSEEMISAAREARTKEADLAKKIEFAVGRAEEMQYSAGGVEDKVDLLTSGAAAHWFDMTRFWVSAANSVKSGGTVALWTGGGRCFCHPSTPNAVRVQEIMSRLEREWLAPYDTPGNAVSREHYDGLLLPWSISPPVDGFTKDGFTKFSWDRDGKLSSGDEFFLGNKWTTVDRLTKFYRTMSAMTRWRKANPGLVGTEEDILLKTEKDLREALGKEELVVGVSLALLLFKRE